MPLLLLLVLITVVVVTSQQPVSTSGQPGAVETKSIRGSGNSVTGNRGSGTVEDTTTSSSKGGTTTTFATTSNPHKASKGEDLAIDINSPVKVVNLASFPGLLEKAKTHPRKRKMTDLTMNPEKNTLQVLVNTWIEGSYSPVHMHPQYSEAFIILSGELAFFTFTEDGTPTCHILSDRGKKAIIVEAGQYHAMTAAPTLLGYSGQVYLNCVYPLRQSHLIVHRTLSLFVTHHPFLSPICHLPCNRRLYLKTVGINTTPRPRRKLWHRSQRL